MEEKGESSLKSPPNALPPPSLQPAVLSDDLCSFNSHMLEFTPGLILPKERANLRAVQWGGGWAFPSPPLDCFRIAKIEVNARPLL